MDGQRSLRVGSLRVGIIGDYQIVVEGLARMFEPFRGWIEVVEPAVGVPPRDPVDIVLCDPSLRGPGVAWDVTALLEECNGRRLVGYSWDLGPDLVRFTLKSGAEGYLDKRLNTSELIEALELVNAGEVVVSAPMSTTVLDPDGWPGREQGLTARESEIVALISQGLSNQEIAEHAGLSINTVKSYIRSSYRKIGVKSRSRAVLWGLEHGVRPDRSPGRESLGTAS